MYGVTLILVVIALSGLIAYVGDQIGMKVGKKRISIFGLRPKHTSILITVLTGVLIAAITISIILATNNGVRQALFRIQEVYTELESTRVELNDLNQQMLEKDRTLRERNELLEEKKEEIQQRKEELDNLQKQKEQLDQQNKLLEEQKNKLEVKLENIQLEYQTAQKNIEDLKETKKNLDSQVSGLENQVTDLKKVRKDLEERISSLKDKIDVLNQEINRVNKELSDTTLRYYLQDLVYQKGDIIYIDVVEKEDTQDSTVDNIVEFVTKANKEVLKRPVKVDQETGSAIRLKNEQIFGMAATILQSDIDKYIVSLVADVNVSQNMIVPVSFQISPDFIVYEKEELITKKVIDASNSFDKIEDELVDILTTINIKSVKKGIITAEQGTVGTIEFSRYYEVLNKIQSYQGDVRVSVYATDNIWVEDGWNGQFSNKIRFEIESVGDSSNG